MASVNTGSFACCFIGVRNLTFLYQGPTNAIRTGK